MIKAEFLRREGQVIGFIVSGHANAGRFGQDIVCAGVSSAVMFVANAITDFFKADAEVKVSKNVVGLKLNNPEAAREAQTLLLALKSHLELMSAEQGNIEIVLSNTRY